MILDLLLGCSIAFTIISSLALILSIKAYVLVKAMEKSTHSVQYVPIDEQFKQESEKQMTEINKKFKGYVEEDFEDILEEQSL